MQEVDCFRWTFSDAGAATLAGDDVNRGTPGLVDIGGAKWADAQTGEAGCAFFGIRFRNHAADRYRIPGKRRQCTPCGALRLRYCFTDIFR